MSGVSAITVSKSEQHVIHHGSLMDQVRADCAALGLDADEFLRGRMKDVTPTTLEHQPNLDISDLA